MTTYCDYCLPLPADNRHRVYHDTQYGFPLADDNVLFERLVLEINQAGLSWDLMLKKAAHFRQAYAGFEVARVAAFAEADRARLLADAGIVRNRLKVNAAIENARRIVALQATHGSWRVWLDAHRLTATGDLRPKAEWVQLFKRTFVFTGGEIVGEFLMSTGYLPGAHTPTCPVYPHVTAAVRAAWG